MFFSQEFLEFTDGGAVIEVDDQAAAMLLLGLVISRGFVATLLLKPIQYGLTEEVPDQIASSNLRVSNKATFRPESSSQFLNCSNQSLP